MLPTMEEFFPSPRPLSACLPLVHQRTVVVEAQLLGGQLSADVLTAHTNSRVRAYPPMLTSTLITR